MVLPKEDSSKDCNAALNAEPARNPLVKGEGIVCLMIPLLLYLLLCENSTPTIESCILFSRLGQSCDLILAM
jgi:hypothetical protein